MFGADDGSAYPAYNETPCDNPNSTCQATGAIGDPTTGGVCIPADTFTAADCPSGTHAIDQGDGTFDCIPPSAVGCNVLDVVDDGAANMSTLGSVCTFDHFGQSVTGVCYGASPGALACVDTCSPDTGADYPSNNGVMCLNTNSVCQATGAIGDPGYELVSVSLAIHLPMVLSVRVVPLLSTTATAPWTASHQVRSDVI